MAGPPILPIQDQVENFLRQENVVARGAQGVLDVPGELLEGATSSAAAEWLAAQGVESGAAVAEAAAGMADMMAIPIVLAVIAIVYLVTFALLLLAKSLESVGIWGIGPKLAGFIVAALAPLVALEVALSNRLADDVSSALHGVVALVQWAMVQRPGTPVDTLTALVQAQLTPIHREVDILQQQITAITSELTGQPGPTVQPPPPPPPIPGSLNDRLTRIEQRNNTQGEQIGQLNHHVAVLGNTVAVLESEVAHLRTAIYGARNSSVGVQDLVHQVDLLRQTTEVELGHAEATLQTHTDALAQLAPLLTLLYLGERGLGNLRTLEDNMCQCPRLPTVGSLIPDALALELAIANGI